MEKSNNYIYGRNAVTEAIVSGKTIEKIFIAFGAQGDNISRIFSLAKKNKIIISTIDRKKFSDLERNNNLPEGKSQGIIALLRSFDLLNIDELIRVSYQQSDKPILIILDEIEDPQNLGAIARSAECAGCSGIILTNKNSSPISPTAIKASAGALEIIKISKVDSVVQVIEKLKESGFWIVGTDMSGDRIYTDKIYDSPIALVIGSEGRGMRPSTIKHCDFLIKIPLLGKINSLNASATSAIVLFEILRQRRSI